MHNLLHACIIKQHQWFTWLLLPLFLSLVGQAIVLYNTVNTYCPVCWANKSARGFMLLKCRSIRGTQREALNGWVPSELFWGRWYARWYPTSCSEIRVPNEMFWSQGTQKVFWNQGYPVRWSEGKVSRLAKSTEQIRKYHFNQISYFHILRPI